MMMKELGQRGFSLAEIIVVLVIVGILTAVALPSFQGFLKEAKVNNLQNQLLAIHAAQKLYNKKTGKYYHGSLTTAQAETCLGKKVVYQGLPMAACTALDPSNPGNNIVPGNNPTTNCPEAVEVPTCSAILKASLLPLGSSTLFLYFNQPIKLTSDFQNANRNPRCINSGAGVNECPL